MVQSVKDTCRMAVQDHCSSPFGRWILKWPGQVVICGNCIHWTAEVTEAMKNRKLPVSQLNSQCDYQGISSLLNLIF
jgi:dynein heavy chain